MFTISPIRVINRIKIATIKKKLLFFLTKNKDQLLKNNFENIIGKRFLTEEYQRNDLT